MKKTPVIAIVVILVGAAAVASHAARRARAADAAAAAVAQESNLAQAEIRQAEQRLARTEREKAEMQSELAGMQKSRAAEPTPVLSHSAGPGLSAQELEKKLAEARQRDESPTTQLLRLEQLRAGLLPGYRQFFEKLRLSPSQIDRFVEINMQRKEADMDVSALVKQGIVAESDPVTAKVRADIKAEQDIAYRELLGESGFQQLQEEWRTEVAKGLVTGFAGMAVISGVPLTGAQLQQLVQIVANADSSYRSGGRVSYSMDTIDWDLVNAQARPLLSEEQWTIFKSHGSPIGYSWSDSRCRSAIASAVQTETAHKGASKPPGN